MRKFALLLALTFVACNHDPGSGRVIARQDTPAHYEDWTQMLCVSYGKYGCNVYIPQQHHDFVPEHWALGLERCDANKPKCKHGWHEVPQEEFKLYLVGDTYPHEGVR